MVSQIHHDTASTEMSPSVSVTGVPFVLSDPLSCLLCAEQVYALGKPPQAETPERKGNAAGHWALGPFQASLLLAALPPLPCSFWALPGTGRLAEAPGCCC